MKFTVGLLTALAALIILGSLARAETIRSSTGATAEVSGSAASNFRCLVSGLESEGYHIDFMGGFRRHGSVRGSLHPAGLALDINQTGRGRVTRRLPSNATSIAAGCGLIHGAVWRNQDQGHFQKGGWGGTVVASRHRGRHSMTASSETTWQWPWSSSP